MSSRSSRSACTGPPTKRMRRHARRFVADILVGRGSVPQGSPRAPHPEADLKLDVRSPPNGDVKFVRVPSIYMRLTGLLSFESLPISLAQ